MNKPSRRHFAQALALGGFGCALSATSLLGRQAKAQALPWREIEVVAQRFKYTPQEIQVRAGEQVVLLVRSLDFVHGMNLPDYGIRADLVPGKIIRVVLSAKPPGVYEFVCDNFCGDGHEEMHGRIVVTA